MKKKTKHSPTLGTPFDGHIVMAPPAKRERGKKWYTVTFYTDEPEKCQPPLGVKVQDFTVYTVLPPAREGEWENWIDKLMGEKLYEGKQTDFTATHVKDFIRSLLSRHTQTVVEEIWKRLPEQVGVVKVTSGKSRTYFWVDDVAKAIYGKDVQ